MANGKAQPPKKTTQAAAAKRRESPARRRALERLGAPPRLPLGRRNWQIMGAGALAILLGFFLLSRGSITAAPFLLVLGYCVLIPVGILLPRRDHRRDGEAPEQTVGAGE